MKPEPGDNRIKVTRADVAAAARSVGIVPGDTVMFHSSLSSMGWVVGGPNAVIDGFLDAVGPGGTVAVPTLWLSRSEPERISEWDVNTSPSKVGLITEVFRKRPDSVRSNNPSHSVSAIGARAVELTRDHGIGPRICCFGDEAFARVSPWQKFYDWNAAYCFIGVDLTVNTMRHFMECLIVERLLAEAPPHKRDELADQVQRRTKDGVWPHHNSQLMEARLDKLGLMRYSKIGSATLRCVRAKPMVDTCIGILMAEPEEWFDAEFLQWMRQARPQPRREPPTKEQEDA